MKEPKEMSFREKVWYTAGVVALITCLLLLFRQTVHLMILILVSILISCYFHGVSAWIRKGTDWKSPLPLLASILGTLSLLAGLTYLIGTNITAQTDQLSDSLPELLDKGRDLLENTYVGKKTSEWADGLNESNKISEFVSESFRSGFGVIGDLYIILAVSLYFIASPRIYEAGMISLVPNKYKDKAGFILNRLLKTLTFWLFGRFLAMFVVFVLTGLGLAILGLPMWLSLAFIAGLFVFIPNFGPILAAIPAVLVGFSESAQTGWIVIILYIVIQSLDGILLTPKIQSYLVKIPPALIIMGQVFMGITLGVWGVVFATPLVLIIMILTQEVYINPMEKSVGLYKP